jgi:hypothetical protein
MWWFSGKYSFFFVWNISDINDPCGKNEEGLWNSNLVVADTDNNGRTTIIQLNLIQYSVFNVLTE